MVRLVITLSIVAVAVRDVWALGAQPSSVDDAMELLQTASDLELVPAESKQPASRLAAHKNKEVAMTLSQKLKKQTSMIVKQKTEELLGRVPGLPPMISPLISWYIYEFVMFTRQTSEGHRQFIDYLFSKVANRTVEELDAPALWHLVHQAANYAHVEAGMKDFLGEMDNVFAQGTSSSPDPKAMFHVLAVGFSKLGVQKEITDFMETSSGMLGTFGTNGTAMVDTSKLFGMMSNLYRSIGLPEELAHIVDEFGTLFVTDPSKTDPSEVLSMIGKILKNLGMPDAITDFCGDMGKLMQKDQDPTPQVIFSMMGNVLTKMGAPPQLASSLQEISKVVDRGYNGTARPQEIMTSLAKNMKVDFHPEALFGSFLQMRSDVQDLVQHDPAPTKERLARAIAPHMLFMVHEGAPGL